MCFSVAFIETSPKKYVENYSKRLNKEISTSNIKNLEPYYFVSGFQFPLLPIVLSDKMLLSNWGLIPYWVKNKANASEIKSKTLNAMGETIFEKPSFKKAIQKQRCILGIKGFYEWRNIQQKKYPYFIYHSKNELLNIGCIYDSWTDTETGEIIMSFSIITTPANKLMEKIHNTKKRMPLILPNEKLNDWLNEYSTVSTVKSLIQPYSDGLLDAHTVSPLASLSRENRNTPEIINPYHYPQLID